MTTSQNSSEWEQTGDFQNFTKPKDAKTKSRPTGYIEIIGIIA